VTVEEVFGSFSPAPQVVARPVTPLGGEGARVTLLTAAAGCADDDAGHRGAAGPGHVVPRH